MASRNPGVRQTLAALAMTLIANLAQSAEVVTGYWSDVSENEPVIEASLSYKASHDPSESRMLKFNLAQLRDALNGAESINIMLPDPTEVRSSLPYVRRLSCQSN